MKEEQPFIDSKANLDALRSTNPATVAALKSRLEHISPITINEAYDGTDAVTVDMESYGITTDQSDTPIIGTAGVGDCIGVILYDQARKIAAAVHLNASTNPSLTLKKILLDLQLDGNSLQAFVWGGIFDDINPLSTETARRTIVALDTLKINIANSDLLGTGNNTSSLFIHTGTGKLFSSAPHAQKKQAFAQGSGEGFSIVAAKAFDGRAKVA